MIIIGIGSNLDNRKKNIQDAIDRLTFLQNIKVSCIYETEALLPEGAPESWYKPYLNLVVSGQTSLSPQSLLEALKVIEQALGRVSAERWAPRIIDLDILLYDDLCLQEPGLIIPHPEFLKRSFALLPAAQIAPRAIHPVAQKPLMDFAASCKTDFIRTMVLNPKVVGIVNITPDSFSDGALDPDKAIVKAHQLVQEGASVIDFGAQSTNPRSHPIDANEEWMRLEPVLQAFQNQDTLISVDTYHPEVARKAMPYIDWINDVSGGKDRRLLTLAAQHDKTIVVMHSVTVPASPEHTLQNDVVSIQQWGERILQGCAEEGVKKLILDPGIGFGKTPFQSLALLRHTGLEAWGVPILIGHSRKSFMQVFTRAEASDRDLETCAICVALAHTDSPLYWRVHNVAWYQRTLVAAQMVLDSRYLFS